MSSQTRTAKSFPREKTQIFAKTGLTSAHRCIIITIVSSEQCVRLATNGFPVFIIWVCVYAALYMEEFPSGQRGQTVNLLLLASVVRIHPPHQKKGLCILQGPFFNEINPFGICEIYLRYSEKTTYGCCEMRCGAWDLFHFTWCVASNFTSAVALISHFASAAGLCQHGRYFAQCPCNFVEIRL